ncbi:VOC family protein [Nguyenibacter vanlangensis]|uniref:VOC family protein n=1 Tax=Nguyenibacter vanlangensis TaxID=1216886 RepID=A0A7Y7IV03_9PROT|nr:VOC family protein [Nguyenibacter vanlangensis]NVN10834.1 VOC family protein [Nguyenibacter vanlangensis]
MLDHVGIGVSDFGRAQDFYDRALKPLGIDRLHGDNTTFAGYGEAPKPIFWIGHEQGSPARTHVAFTAADRQSVDQFYSAALAAGGRDNGPPGLRTQYHPDYYGAFVLDPDGHNIEAVCHKPAAP